MRQADSIQIAQLPLRIEVGSGSLSVGPLTLEGTFRATIYDLGAVAIALALPLPNPTGWTTVAELFRLAPELPPADQLDFERAVDDLVQMLGPAVTRPRRSAIVEDSSVLVVDRLAPDASVADRPGDRAGARKALTARR